MPLAHEYELHYRCSFEITASQQVTEPWKLVANTIRTWLISRVPRDLQVPTIGGTWVFVGGDWRSTKNGRFSIQSRSSMGSGRAEAPEFWAVRFQNPCKDVPARQWQTDIGVTRIDQNRIIFALSTIHWMPPGYLGEETPPVPSAPRIVLDLLRTSVLTCRAGSEQFYPGPLLLQDGRAELVVRQLVDVGRVCPTVLIALDFDTEKPLINPTTIARLLAGAARVFASQSSWVDKELERLVGRDFSCWNGMVRVYQPRVTLGDSADSRRHRFFTKSQILEKGASQVEEMLVRSVVRRARYFLPVVIHNVADVDAKEAQQRFREELAKAKKGSQEWTQLQEDEVVRLASSLRSKEEEISMLIDQLEQAEDMQDEIARLKFDLGAAKVRAEEAESVRSALASQAAILANLDKFPTTVSDVLDIVEKSWPDKVIFTPKAKLSAAEATLRSPNIAWKCLRSMATVLHDLHFNKQLNLREISRSFRDMTGFELAVAESETTKGNRKLAAMRKDLYKGEAIDISVHVKYGTSAGNNLRVHYYAHPKEKRLVVGHCGDHLDTVKTN